MRYLPVFLDLDSRKVVVSGGRAVAVAKLRTLLKTKANIHVYSASPDFRIVDWSAAQQITLHRRFVNKQDLAGAAVCYAASGNPEEDECVSIMARQTNVLLNRVDDLESSQFITPAIVDRDPVLVAISTEGSAPVLARKIKSLIEISLPVGIGGIARIAGSFRKDVKKLSPHLRRNFWEKFFSKINPVELNKFDETKLRGKLRTLFDHDLKIESTAGSIAFIGAGPGTYELLTLKAYKILRVAEVVIHDRLIDDTILDVVRAEAHLISVGKTGFRNSITQEEINQLMVNQALRGKTVVRLKGGDPAIFGRLDEEVDACELAGIHWEVIPGVTAASGAAASIGRSLTRRNRNSDVRFLTGYNAEGYAEHDWVGLAKENTVAAIYMGKKSASFIQGKLLMHGAKPNTPVTVIENACRPDQKIFDLSLSQLCRVFVDKNVSGPTIFLLGLAGRDTLASFGEFSQRSMHEVG
ncbi:MAG: siroheme synthase CysG [Gammaproteobacteria bacterium]|nr:siroheme synthase CysG [Gammaproteobacteria bacterium]